MKTDKAEMEIQHKCFQQGVYYIEGKKKRKINMTVVKDVKN